MPMPADDLHGSLTPAAKAILDVDAATAYEALVVSPSAGNAAARRLLETLKPEGIFVDHADGADGRAALAGLWLWHDWLDESHAISQRLPDATGSFWHAIMHRREGDFSNSKYWYARCREHPVLLQLADEVAPVIEPIRDLQPLVAHGRWQPDRFVDLVARAHRSPSEPVQSALVRLQRMEWRALFGHGAGE